MGQSHPRVLLHAQISDDQLSGLTFHHIFRVRRDSHSKYTTHFNVFLEQSERGMDSDQCGVDADQTPLCIL